MTFAVSFGKYGGFYVFTGISSWRLCMGWVALTILFVDLDPWLEEQIDREEREQEALVKGVGRGSVVLKQLYELQESMEVAVEEFAATMREKLSHEPAVLRPDWSMTARRCKECGAVLHPVAVWEGDGWVLTYDYCDTCGDDRDTMTEIEWPFMENWATRQDFERVGFRVE